MRLYKEELSLTYIHYIKLCLQKSVKSVHCVHCFHPICTRIAIENGKGDSASHLICKNINIICQEIV